MNHCFVCGLETMQYNVAYPGLSATYHNIKKDEYISVLSEFTPPRHEQKLQVEGKVLLLSPNYLS